MCRRRYSYWVISPEWELNRADLGAIDGEIVGCTVMVGREVDNVPQIFCNLYVLVEIVRESSPGFEEVEQNRVEKEKGRDRYQL